MGHHTARNSAFVTTLAAAAIALMLAAGDSIALEATEIGPGPAGQGVSPAVAGKGEGPWAKAGSTLRRVFTAHSAHQQAGGGAPFNPGNPSIQFANGLILIDAVAASDGAALLDDLRGVGLTGGTQFGAVVSGRIPLGLLNEIVGLGSLRGVSASLKPETNSTVDTTFGLVHDRRAAIAMSLIASQADPQTYTGEGIKVGVLSDTFDNNGFPDYDGDGWPDLPATFAADDLANGDLPDGAGTFVALHAPGDVDDDDKSAFGAIGTSGANATAGDATHPNKLAANIRFAPSTFTEPLEATISYADAPQQEIGAKPFTIEMWAYFETLFPSSERGERGPMLAAKFSIPDDQRGFIFWINGQDDPVPNSLSWAVYPDNIEETLVRMDRPWVPTTGRWYHLAITRDDQMNMRMFVDGNQLGAEEYFPAVAFDVNEELRISGFDNPNFPRPLDGWVEDFRFVVGEAMYTSNFTPPGPLASELPPPPTPAATTTVLDDTANPGIDEGRAMMQLIHDVAPDASVSFHTAFNGMADFAQGIQDLADDGADVIVDDIIYFAEPMFQDGIIAQAVDNVVGQGKAYFSSAGNAAQHSYESPFVSSGERLSVKPFIGPNEPRGMLHDFDTGGGVDWKQSVTIPTGTVFTMVAQWDQPFASNCPGCPGSENDVDIYLVDDNNNIITSSIADNLASGDPVEVLQFQNTGATTSYHIMMTHYDVVTAPHPQPGPPPTLMKYVWFGHSSITINEHTSDSPASYGHSNAAGAAAVGAAFYLDTPAFGVPLPLRESFSSQGGIPILFDVSGNALGIPVVREKPEFVAPDGTNTTFFFRDTSLDDADEAPEVFPNFFGTSAAAPHAAAIAALMLEANPALTPADIYAALESTAVNMGPAGFDHDTGYGLIDATAALAQVTGGNLVPLAENDIASTDQNTLVSIPVLANDAPGDPTTTITLVTDPPHGTAVINGTAVDYTPDTDYFGPDSFDYTIQDNNGETSVATVNVTVNEIDIQPLAADDDNEATNEDAILAGINVMGNDIPLGNAPTTITAAGPGKLGSNVTTDGATITYQPAPDDFGIDTFPYTITDVDGDSSNANVTVAINPVNDAPVADNDPTSTDEDTPVGFDDALMLAGDTDIENDPLSISLVFNTSAQGGAVSDIGGGNYTYTPPENFNGNDAVNYVVSDGTDTDTGTVTITVNPVNDAPDAGSVANQNSQDGDAGITVVASTTDIENDTLTYSVGGQPAGLSIDINTGEITGTIDANASAGGAGGVYNVTVTASDAGPGTDYDFTWTVSSGPVPNAPPTAAAGPDQNVADSDGVAGESVTLDGSGSSDSDGTVASYAWSWTGGGSAVGVSPVVNLPDGTTVVSLVVTDNDGAASTADTVSITVNAANTIPADPTAVSANNLANGSAQISWIDNSGNEDGFEIQREKQNKKGAWRATNIIATTGANATSHVDGSGNGTFRYQVRSFNGIGSSPWSAWAEITVTSDGGGGNLLPNAVDDSNTTIVDTPVNGNVLANDDQGDAPATVTGFDAAGTLGGGVTMAVNGDYTYTPPAGISGVDTFGYTITDADVDISSATVTITINAAGGGVTIDSATGYRAKGLQKVDMTWSGATTADVFIKRDGVTEATTTNDGAYTDNIDFKGGGSYNYQICETGVGGACSGIVTVVF